MRRLIKIFLFLGVASCGGGSFDFPQYAQSPQGSDSENRLQIFLAGDAQALSALTGYDEGETLYLEARGFPSGATPSWNTTDLAVARFQAPGKLYLANAGRTEVVVLAAGQRVRIPLQISPGSSPVLENPPPPVNSDPYVDEVVSFDPGPYAGFGQGDFPDIVLGGPQGGGANQGGLDVLSLGVGGSIVLRSDTPILNGNGPDFIVFENAFHIAGNPGSVFAELGEVSVSQDGSRFYDFSCEQNNSLDFFPNCAGKTPVYANVLSNSIDPTDPNTAGGDTFDLSDLGLSWIQFIRILDLSENGSGTSAGFDLDAIAIVYQ